MLEFLLSCIILSLKVALGTFILSLGMGVIAILIMLLFPGGPKFGSGG